MAEELLLALHTAATNDERTEAMRGLAGYLSDNMDAKVKGLTKVFMDTHTEKDSRENHISLDIDMLVYGSLDVVFPKTNEVGSFSQKRRVTGLKGGIEEVGLVREERTAWFSGNGGKWSTRDTPLPTFTTMKSENRTVNFIFLLNGPTDSLNYYIYK